jgi:hypothetical protein
MAHTAVSEHIGKKLPEIPIPGYRNYVEGYIKRHIRSYLLNKKDEYIDRYEDENRIGIGARVLIRKAHNVFL